MEIEVGLFEHMVMQRTNRDVSNQVVNGKCAGIGTIQARVVAAGKVLKGWNWGDVGRATGRTFECHLRGLPVGGPYNVELRLKNKDGNVCDTVHLKDILIGDLWVLAGQSNMQGIGLMKDRLKPVFTVRAYHMNDEWEVAEDPLHALWCALAPVHGGNPKMPRKPCPTPTGVGPGLSFGQEMLRRTGIPQGLIACAHGGSSMSQWDPALKSKGGGSMYGAMVDRVVKNGGCVAGVLWYQGCSDTNEQDAALYTKRMNKLVRSMRRDFGSARLPFAMVQISRMAADVCGSAPYWNSIRDQQRRLPGVIPGCTVVPAIDLSMDDAIHLSGSDQNRLGLRLAYAMEVLRCGGNSGRPPIAVKNVKIGSDPVTIKAMVTVEFSNVVGKLRTAGRPSGFQFKNMPPAIYRIDLEGNKALVRVDLPKWEVEGAELYYGAGLDPYCNITDEADRSLPAFGPIRVGIRRHALMGFVKKLRVSKLLPTTDLARLKYPGDFSGLGLEAREFAGNFCDRHNELSKAGAALVYFVCKFKCPEPMSLAIHFGYDGPTKAWLNTKEIFYDQEGINPADPTDATLRFKATTGEHELVVALDSNKGQAWGVFLRFEREKVTKRMMNKWPMGVPLPEMLG